MISVEEALDRILSRVAALGDERVPLTEVLHRVLAEDVDSPRDMPPWPASSMDGYALRSADVGAASAEAPARLAVVAHVAAGATAERPLRAGEAFRIFTGAPIPEGADSVIPQEDVRAEGDTLLVPARLEAGAFVRPRGEDMKRADRVLDRSRVLSAADIGLLATVGRAMVSVIRRPRVGILSTGDELVDLGGRIGPGQIPNSNSYSLIAQVIEAGAQPVSLGIARDRREDIEARLRWGLGCDLIMSSAGVSVGEHDFVKDALARLGAEQHLWLVDMRPGKPIAFSTIPQEGKGALALFALPGNPVSAMVTFELFVRPAILRMAGHTRLHRPTLTARALAPIKNGDNRRGYLRITLTPDGEGHGARLTGTQSSGVLRSMVTADGLAVVPGGTTIQPGEPVKVIVLRPAL
ncbi:MAG: gephyrin-like molybdotransferase Glp [Candidatus Rokuibacteriota bacterium]